MALVMQKPVTKTTSITTTQSTTLVKNLFRAALSSIAYIRDFFDDDCFQLAKIGTARYHKIVTTKRDDVKSFVDWIEQGVFDALQKKYLHVVLLQVFGEPVSRKKKGVKRELLECYSFTITYTDGEAQLSVISNGNDRGLCDLPKTEIKHNASQVLRSLVQMTSSLDPLPRNRIIGMKLLYTENTPVEYEPPLFRKAPDEESSWFLNTSPMEAGSVTTPYHQFTMTIHAGEKTANEENKPHVKDGEEDINAQTSGRQMEIEKNNNGPDKECDQGTVLLDVGSSNANSGRVIKKFHAESQQMDNRCQKPSLFNVLTRKKGVKTKKTRRASAQKDKEEAKTARVVRPKKKRKASVTERDISEKRQCGRKSM